jgi:hypothetical protein
MRSQHAMALATQLAGKSVHPCFVDVCCQLHIGQIVPLHFCECDQGMYKAQPSKIKCAAGYMLYFPLWDKKSTNFLSLSYQDFPPYFTNRSTFSAVNPAAQSIQQSI